MKVNRRWIQQILSHLQYRGNMAADGKNISGVDILVPEDVMNILREALPGYESIVFFDLETTGLLPEKDRMLQLSAVSIKMSTAKLLSFNTYIRLEEGMVVPQKITELTGITDEMSKQYGISEEKALLLRWFRSSRSLQRKRALAGLSLICGNLIRMPLRSMKQRDLRLSEDTWK